MPTAQDFLNALDGANGRLDGVNNRLDTVNNRLDEVKGKLDLINQSVQDLDQTLNWGFSQLITIGNYTNQALHHNAKQNDTIICILEHISQNTCGILNEAHEQTGLQTVIKDNTTVLADLYAATHAEAALNRQREEALRKQIEECCPPDEPPPPCAYQRCPDPGDLSEPPRVDPLQAGEQPVKSSRRRKELRQENM
jgi:hypothetical protein